MYKFINYCKNFIYQIKNYNFEILKNNKTTITKNLQKINYIATCFLFLITIPLFFYVFSAYFKINIIKNSAIWCGLILMVYWIIAAVLCLFDKDDYGRDVSASNDFYNTAFSAFWLVEGFLLSLFLSYARLFDYSDPFLESEEIEHLFINEDSDGKTLKQLLVMFVSANVICLAVDWLIVFETYNVYFLVGSMLLISVVF